MKRLLKKMVRSVAYAGFWEPIWDCVRDFGAVMMLHSVSSVDPKGLEENQSLRTSPERLDGFLTAARRKGFALVSMDEIVETLAAGKPIAKRLALTADDGLLDNFTQALPVVKAHNAPLCVNLATGLMSGETIPWWEPLEAHVLAHDEISLPDGRTFPARTAEEKREAFRQARWWIQKLPYESLNAELSAFFGQSTESLRAMSRGAYVPLTDLPVYLREPLLTLGAHTHSHFACENFSPERFSVDLEENLRRLASVGVKPRHFAYPYGRDLDMARRFAPILRDHGFVSAQVTKTDVLMRGTDPFLIPRLALSEFPGETQLPYAALARRTLFGKAS